MPYFSSFKKHHGVIVEKFTFSKVCCVDTINLVIISKNGYN